MRQVLVLMAALAVTCSASFANCGEKNCGKGKCDKAASACAKKTKHCPKTGECAATTKNGGSTESKPAEGDKAAPAK